MDNLGVLLGKRDSDFIGGTIPYEVRVPSGDWGEWLPSTEKQKDPVETMACVTFSALNSLETQYKFLTGQEINFSDRFTAKMSDTTPQGNYQYKVADSIRKDGLVLESDYPSPTGTFDWNIYYQQIPQSVKDKAIKFDIAYEWIDNNKEQMLYHVKHAPLQIVIMNGRHAVENFFIRSEQGVYEYFDSYVPFWANTQTLTYPLKIVLTIKNMFDLVKTASRPEQYVIINGGRFWVLNEKDLQSKALIGHLSPLREITEAELLAYPDCGVLGGK